MNFKIVAKHHRLMALKEPCEYAEQCTNPQYFFTVNPAQNVTCGVCLTVNVGEE